MVVLGGERGISKSTMITRTAKPLLLAEEVRAINFEVVFNNYESVNDTKRISFDFFK